MAKASISIRGLDALERKFQNLVEVSKERLVEQRAAVVTTLVDEFCKNLPVWSGRAIASIKVDESAVAKPVGHPQRGGLAPEGKFHTEPSFGVTSRMPLGQEPMRRAAETLARMEASKAARMTGRTVIVSLAHPVMDALNQGTAPTPQKARNKGVVLETAIAAVKAKHRSVK